MTEENKMAINYSKPFDTRSAKRSNKTGVYTKVAEAQVKNSCGAFVWEVNDWDRLNRFLILGAEGGTYYVGERDLVKANHDVIVRLIKSNGPKVVQTVADVSVAGRAYKNDPAVFVLALCSAHGDTATKQAAHAAVPQVCRIGTHLFHWMQYTSALRGIGRGVRNALSKWYTEMPVEKLAYQAVKYQQRDGWSHRDLLRQSHTVTDEPARDAVFRWMIGGTKALDARVVARKALKTKVDYGSVREHLPAVLEAFEKAKTADTKTLVKLIAEHNLPREAVPTERLGEVVVWEALLEKMPLNAVIRNLGKMTSVGVLKPLSMAARIVNKRLEDEAYLKKSRVHPMQVLLAAKVYAQGRGIKGSLTWTPVPAVLSALDSAFYKTFTNVVPCGKPLLIALDVSSSMTSSMMGTPMTACEAVAALSLVHASVEPEVHVFGFCHQLVPLTIRKGMSLPEACREAQRSNFGSTNVSLAYELAIKEKMEVGGFIVMTDNETNGGTQPFQRLRAYREKFVQDARSVVVATTSTGFSVNNPDDKFGLDVAGFDASVPSLVADFIRGDLGEAAPSEEADSAD